MRAAQRTAATVGDLSEQPRELLAREEAPLVELVGATAATARQQHQRLRAATEQPDSGGVGQAWLQRQHRVADRAVAQPVPVLIGQPTQPVHERARPTLIDVAQALARLKVCERVGDQQPPVLATGASLITSLAPRPA